MKKNKGLTLITVVLLIIIITIITSITAINFQEFNSRKKLEEMYNDIDTINEKVNLYYLQKNVSAIIEGNAIENIPFPIEIRNKNDNSNYFKINDSFLSDLYLKSKGDFVINERSLAVYFLEGVEYKEIMYYSSNTNSVLINNIANTPKIDGLNKDVTYFVTWGEDQNEVSNIKITENEPEMWYDYSSNVKKWANIKTVGNNKTAYWVWIPRYAYKITYYTDNTKTTISDDKTIYGSIDIKFLQNTSNIAYGENETITDEWTVHSGFKFNNIDLEGIWVAKYQARGTADNIIINQDANKLLTNINTAFSECRKLEAIGGTLGLNMSVENIATDGMDATKNIDIHLMKNNEWGAISYLTYSIYGNLNLTNLQSSTDNEYGIFELVKLDNGEITAAYYDEERLDIIGNANNIYKNKYSIYNNLILNSGEAIEETSILDSGLNSFEGANSSFLNTTNKVLARGENGLMGFNAELENGEYSFRPVMILK